MVAIITDVYTDSTFQVQTKKRLTTKITRHRGIVQGCPWTAIAFIQALDPLIRWIELPFSIDSFPTLCQAYIDDVCASVHRDEDMKDMIEKTETFLNYTGHGSEALEMCNNPWTTNWKQLVDKGQHQTA